MADIRALPAAAALMLLAACAQGDTGEAGSEAGLGEPISCAIAPASEMTANCTVERDLEDGILFLTLHHEDGSFRRLRVMDDGSGVSAADGADEVRLALFDGEIEVQLGGDRYLLPATITDNDVAYDAE